MTNRDHSNRGAEWDTGYRVFNDVTEAHRQAAIRKKVRCPLRKCPTCHRNFPEAEYNFHRELCIEEFRSHPKPVAANECKSKRIATRPGMTNCSLCGQQVRIFNLSKHIGRVHSTKPDRRLPSAPTIPVSSDTLTRVSVSVSDLTPNIRSFAEIRAYLRKHHPQLHGRALSDAVRALRDQLPPDLITPRQPSKAKSHRNTKTKKKKHLQRRSIRTVSGGKVSPR